MANKFKIGDKVKFLNSIGGGIVTKITNDFIFVRDDTGFDMPMPAHELIRMEDMSGAGKMFNKNVDVQAPPPEELRKKAEEEHKSAAREAELNRKLKEKFTGVADDANTEKLQEENKRLRSQVANLQDQVNQLKRRLQQIQNHNAREFADNILLQYVVRSGEAEVDLHIEALHEHPERLTDEEKHELQLRYFRNCLNHALLNGFKRVVFIHGVGRGVLKSEIQKELDRYENIEYVDAPKAVYGAGATEVYIK